MQECLNAGKEGEHACQHCNGNKNVLPIYYSGNPNYEGLDAKLLSQGAQDGCAKARWMPKKTQRELGGEATVEGRDRLGCHIGASPFGLEYPLLKNRQGQIQWKCCCHELVDERKQDS